MPNSFDVMCKSVDCKGNSPLINVRSGAGEETGDISMRYDMIMVHLSLYPTGALPACSQALWP
jgi:hypothetical protein